MDTASILLVVLVVAFIVVLALSLAAQAVLGWSGGSYGTPLARRLAQERADALLRDVLTASEYALLGARGYLEVRSPSLPMRTYRVPRRPGRVAVHEGDVEVETLCVAPFEWLPPGDVVLAHKLMIEGNEQEYLRRANHMRLRAPNRAPTGAR